jgi:CRP-like cAMP-binding protein
MQTILTGLPAKMRALRNCPYFSGLGDDILKELAGSESARLTQYQLAARLGTVREVVARALRQLERSGAIRLDRRQIQIVDERVLKQWGEGIG